VGILPSKKKSEKKFQKKTYFFQKKITIGVTLNRANRFFEKIELERIKNHTWVFI